MENKKKIRKNAPVQSSSSSDDSSSSTSDSSADARRKQKHRNIRKQRDSSSSSNEEVVRKPHKHQHKKSSSSSAQRKHSHSSKTRTKLIAVNAKKELRSISPTSRAAHKHHLKPRSSKKPKIIDEHERHPVQQRRDVIKDPEHRITSPTTRIRVSIPNNRVQDRVSRSVKDTPSTSTSRRHVRETPEDHLVVRQKEKMRRMQEEEHYGKYLPKADRVSRISPEKHHQHERSRSRSHGRVPIRERLDKDYAYRGTISRERDYSPMIRTINPGNPPMSVERPYDYRGGGGGAVGADERRIPPHDYNSQPRMYEERHHPRGSNWDEGRGEPDHPRGNRGYEGSGRDWEHSHDRKRGIDEPSSHYKDRQWNDSSHRADKEPKEWTRGGSSWKDQGSHPSNQIAPTMSHPRRWPGPNGSDSWSPRVPHPSKLDHLSPGPPFKPRGSYFGFKRFPFKRFPNQYSKINYSSRRVLPSSTETTSTVSSDKTEVAVEMTSENDKQEALESGEIPSEIEEEKVAQQQQQPDTTSNAEAAEECEGNLSEFSDVDDDILNREEVS